ncbi:hypothetical protein C8F04DRAFT_1196620 [Mycena alexandri]|uniref:Uncharacterized protein n=1 Tax=Mycena alexandri TaxID=1745969 RepID=A0AAD6WN00_9AGAR|nr:hypothetical protein C8F04DRAFT_1196620 [Mycena alexandri]
MDDDEDEGESNEGDTDVEGEVILKVRKKTKNLTDGFRIFTKAKLPAEPEDSDPPPRSNPEDHLTVSYAAHMTKNSGETTGTGAGVWTEEDHSVNAEIKIPVQMAQSRQNAEAVATLVATQKTALSTELRLEGARSSVAIVLSGYDIDMIFAVSYHNNIISWCSGSYHSSTALNLGICDCGLHTGSDLPKMPLHMLYL